MINFSQIKIYMIATDSSLKSFFRAVFVWMTRTSKLIAPHLISYWCFNFIFVFFLLENLTQRNIIPKGSTKKINIAIFLLYFEISHMREISTNVIIIRIYLVASTHKRNLSHEKTVFRVIATIVLYFDVWTYTL